MESTIPNRDERHPRVNKHLVRIMRVVMLFAKRSEPPLVARAPVDLHHVCADFGVLAALKHTARRARRTRAVAPHLKPRGARLGAGIRVALATRAVNVAHLEVRIHGGHFRSREIRRSVRRLLQTQRRKKNLNKNFSTIEVRKCDESFCHYFQRRNIIYKSG